MTRAERAHLAAVRYTREAVDTRDPLALAAAHRDLDTATRRLDQQRRRCETHVYETSDLRDDETLAQWRAKGGAA
jgi:uncharacterized membrane-anchored protein YhcB (DUF1043 family)